MTQTGPDQGLTAFSHDGGDVGVLLCHGFPGAPGSMRPWADHLLQGSSRLSFVVPADCPVQFLDLLASGGEGQNGLDATVTQLALARAAQAPAAK